MVYAKIENGQIVKTGNLFDMDTRNSNPTLLSEDELKNLGVYKIISDSPELKPWEKLGVSDYDYNEFEECVYELFTINDIPLEEFKQTKLNEIKQTHEQIQTEGFTSSTGIKIDCKRENVNDFSNNMVLLNESGAGGTKVTDFNNNGIDVAGGNTPPQWTRTSDTVITLTTGGIDNAMQNASFEVRIYS